MDPEFPRGGSHYYCGLLSPKALTQKGRASLAPLGSANGNSPTIISCTMQKIKSIPSVKNCAFTITESDKLFLSGTPVLSQVLSRGTIPQLGLGYPLSGTGVTTPSWDWGIPWLGLGSKPPQPRDWLRNGQYASCGFPQEYFLVFSVNCVQSLQ